MITRRAWLASTLAAAAGMGVGCRHEIMAAPGAANIIAEEDRPTDSIQADVLVYGATPAGVVAAVEAAARGRSVFMVGGWRDRHLGGMMSGGLGWTDYLDPGGFGGHPEAAVKTISNSNPLKINQFTFLPEHAERYFNQLMAAHRVPVYWSQGVESVDKSGAAIRSFTTVDGLRAAGRVFIDASYGGDLLAQAGVSYQVGRETADLSNSFNGFRGVERPARGGNHQFSIRGEFLAVDPFNRPGAPESGLIAGVNPASRLGVGQSDKGIQAYNYRMCMTRSADLRQDLPSTPPDGYAKSDYEGLFRYIEAIEQSGRRHGQGWNFTEDLILANDLGGGIYDVNARGGFSTDPFGLNWAYPEADYPQREIIWKQHEAHVRGFFYALAWEKDPRLPPGLQAEVRTWGLVKDQFREPHPNDTAGWPYQLYVREARRMQGAVVWTGADLQAADGLAPRSRSVVAIASYRQDSHHVQRLAVPTETGWKLWNEGNFETGSGGQDGRSPLPYEIITPHRGECTNLLAPFCVSATHQAFSAIRMELSAMALGQCAGAAAAIICEQSASLAVQDVPYPLLRDRLLRGGAILSELNGAELFLDRTARRVAAAVMNRLPS